jgi:DNA polymerase I-like protein with 3'-5' exonuclease and polymerase domains
MITTLKITKENFSDAYLQLSEQNHLGFDTETTGNAFEDVPFCLTLATYAQAYYFDIRDGFPGLGLLLNNPNITFYGFNAKFDTQMLMKKEFIPPARIHDVYIIERLLRNDQLSYSLKNVARKYGYAKSDGVERYIKENDLYQIRKYDGRVMEKVPEYHKVPEEIIMPYAGQDAWLHLQIGLRQVAELKKLDSE